MEESNKQLRMEVRSRSRNRVSPVRFRSASLNKYKSKYRNYIRDSSDDSTDYGTYRNGNLSRNKHRTNLTRNRRMRSSNESLSSTQSFNMKQRLLPSNRSNSNESIKLLERRKNYSNSIRDRNRNILLKKKKKKCKSINMEDSVTFTSLNEKINDLQNFLCNV
ncbi:hypothetical protein SNEBB_001735 [Seison nebaliae]|nr:hypothetical protein SNEBB_001735 [Seison nebaliae]